MTQDQAMSLLNKYKNSDVCNVAVIKQFIEQIYADFKLELEAEYKRGWKDRHTQSDLEGRRCESCNIEKKRETHLCNTCALEFATCKSTIIFGDAPTKDNVYKCNAFREIK